MRVLHVISSGGLYGAEAVILQLSAVINSTPDDVSEIAVFHHAGQPVPDLHLAAGTAKVPSHMVPCRGQIDLAVGGELRHLAEQTGAEVIHAHGYKADIYVHFAFRNRTRPALVSTCHTWYDNDLAVKLYGAADRWVLRGFDEVVAVSSEVQGRLARAGVQSNRLHLIRNGISLPFRSSSANPEAPLADSRRPRIGLVGRLAPEKGVDLFLAAAHRLRPRFPGAQFIVAGEGSERASLEQQKKRLELAGFVELPGQQTDMSGFYRSLDLLVSSSRQEGLPMALLEGMAAGLPVVATTVGEVGQVVVPGETGLLVPPNNPELLAEAIARLLDSSSLRQAFGAAGKERVEADFSARGMASAYLAIYHQALAGRRANPGPGPGAGAS